MTPEEFAAQTGLSLEEAEMVLSARAAKAGSVTKVSLGPGGWQGTKGQRFLKAMEILNRAESKVGVEPYQRTGLSQEDYYSEESK